MQYTYRISHALMRLLRAAAMLPRSRCRHTLSSWQGLVAALSLWVALPCATAYAGVPQPSVSSQAEHAREVVVIDTGIDDWRTLARGVSPGAMLVRVSEGEDGLGKLAAAVQGRNGIRALHIVSHGSVGAIRLGGTRIDQGTLDARRRTLHTIGAALAPGADILLAGCEVAYGGRGAQFMQFLSNLTGADVAGSIDVTGAKRFDADWKLEARTGLIDSRLALSAGSLQRFEGRLPITGQRTYSFDAKYPTSDPCVVNQELLTRTSSGGTTCTGDLEADGTADVLEFTNWHWDTFFSPDIGLSLRDTLPAGTIADPAGDSFKFTSFTTEVFSCGVPISFEVVGYEDGSPVGTRSFNFGSFSGVTTRIIEFASVDEVRFENYSDGNPNVNNCMTVDDIVVDQAVSSNTQPDFSNLDATVLFDEAAGSAVAIDTDVTVSDAELDGLGDYAGSTLTVAREGGANDDDDFGFDTASASFSVSGGDLLSGGAVFASFTESGGTLTVNFNSNVTTATPALADEVLQSLTYVNTGSPVVVEYGVTLNFDDGGLQTAQSLPVEYDPVLTAVTSNTAWDFTELGPTLPDKETVDARVVAESGFDLLFYGFKFGDAAENALIDSNEFQLDQRTSDPATTGTRFEADEPFSLEQLDIDNSSTSAQDVEVHAYLDGSPVGSRSFSYGAENGYQTEQFASADAVFANIDEIRFTTSVNGSVAIDNIIVDQGNAVPSLDLDTGTAGDDSRATFGENTDQGTAAGDGVALTGAVVANDPDGTIETVTLTLDNPQGDAGEGVAIDTAPLAGALGFSTSANQITITRNTATNAELVEAIEAVRYQNNSDNPDTTARTVTIAVTDDRGATVSATSTMTVEAGNDAPTITGPGGTLQPTEDVAFDLSGANEIQIGDVDAKGGTVEVSLSANNGTLTLGQTTGIAFDSGGNGTGAFTVSGMLPDLNNALATLDYQGDADYFGADTLSAIVNDRGNTGTDPGNTSDGGSEEDSTSVSLDVQPVPDAPTISTIANQSTDEDTTISGIAFTIDDAETPADNLTLGFSGVIAGHSFSGSGANRTLAIVPADDANGTVVVTVEVSDGGLTVQEDFALTVNAVNDLPTVTPAISTLDKTVNEDGVVPSESITVDDVENGGTGVVVTVSSDNQTLVPDANLSVTSTGGGGRTLGVTLAPDENGTAEITVTLDDGTDTVDDSFTLTVNPQNDPPTVSLDQTSNTIPENNGGNVAVAQIIIDDDNEDGSTNILSLTGADAGDFAINGSDLDFTGSADFETKSAYNVTVEVDDPGIGATPDDSEAFTLNITDVDEAPVFPANGPFDVDEGAGNGTAVGDVDATDGDGGPADANLTYAIVGGNIGGAFAIDGATGAIAVADGTAVDFDSTPTFILDVEADDGANASTAEVTVNVKNEAPSTPLDSDGPSGGSVAEDATNGTLVGVTADSSDPGGGNVSYALANDAGGRFQINAGTGVVTVANASLIDFESATSHAITVQAADDDGTDSGTASFTIAVSDVDSPPAFTETGPFMVSESAGTGTAVGDVDANDGDTGSTDTGVTYAITGGNGGGAFAIDNSGAITVTDDSLIDFESASFFALAVEADDGGSTTSATVTVNVGDEPPTQPSDTDGAADAVAEDATNGATVGVDVTATDPAGGAVSYALVDDADGRFAIDGGGAVTVADGSLLDFESATSHTLEIEARDADGTASATLSVTVAIIDVADDPTVTAPPDLTGSDAIDATGLYTEVDLERLGDASADDDEDGSIAPEPVDVENPARLRPGTHTITWSVTDSDGGTGTDDQIVEVRPRVGIGPDRTVQEGTTIEIPIELNGDPIDGATPTIDFEVVGGSAIPTDYAGVGAPGSITILAGRSGSLDFDVLDEGDDGEGSDTLVLELTDTDENTVLADRTRVTISIVEENTPPMVSLEAEQGPHNPAVVIDGTPGAAPVTVTADTNDATDPGDMTFEWNAGATGLIDTDGTADNETFRFDPTQASAGVYEIQVFASDNGSPRETGSAALSLRVVDAFPALGGDDSDGDGVDDDDPAEGRSDRDGDGLPDYLDPYREANTIHQSLADGTGFQLETEPGLDIAQGAVAFARDVEGAQVTAGAIAAVLGQLDDRENVGGYFDFTIRGLPVQGGSARVVIPQREPVPAEAVYRKLGAVGGWMDFIEDGNNVVTSSPGVEGFCPPPDAPVYTRGLTAGDWCVRLTIEDGGPNDADGAANGRITDPGGVGLGTTVDEEGVEASNDGGGSLGPIALVFLLLSGIAGCQRARSQRGVQ
jgi:hypothetical protein